MGLKQKNAIEIKTLEQYVIPKLKCSFLAINIQIICTQSILSYCKCTLFIKIKQFFL